MLAYDNRSHACRHGKCSINEVRLCLDQCNSYATKISLPGQAYKSTCCHTNHCGFELRMIQSGCSSMTNISLLQICPSQCSSTVKTGIGFCLPSVFFSYGFNAVKLCIYIASVKWLPHCHVTFNQKISSKCICT